MIKIFNLEEEIGENKLTKDLIEEWNQLFPAQALKKKPCGTQAHHLSDRNASDIKLNQTIETTHSGNGVIHLTLLEQGQKLLSTGYDGNMEIYDLSTYTREQTLSGHTDWVWSVLELKSGVIASVSRDKSIKLWDKAENGIWECIKTLQGHNDWVTSIIELPDNKILTGSTDGELKVWDNTSDSALRTFATQTRERIFIVIQLGVNTIAVGSSNDIEIMNFEEGTNKATLRGHTALVRDLFYLEKTNELLSASEDKSIKLWSLETSTQLKEFLLHTAGLDTIVRFNEELFASSCDDGTVKIWNLNGECVQTLNTYSGWIVGLIILPDGQIAFGGAAKKIFIYG